MAPRIVDREEKRLELIRAATSMFVEQGLANTRMADIAVRAGVGKGTIYEYFESKEELFFAVFSWINSKIAQRVLEQVDDSRSASEQLAILLDFSGTLVRDLRDSYNLSMDFWSACRGSSLEKRLTEAISEVYDQYRNLLAGIVRRGQEDGEFGTEVDADNLASMLVGSFDGLGVQYWIDASVDPVACATAFRHTILAGLQCHSGG